MLTFKLQKYTLLVILVLVAMAGTLTFTAGMVVGVHWTLSNPELEVMLASRAATQTPESKRTAAATTQRVPSQATVSPSTAAAQTRPAAVTPVKPVVNRPTITTPAVTKPTVTRPAVTRPAVTTAAITPVAVTPAAVTTPEPAEPPPSLRPVQVAADSEPMGAVTEEPAAMTDTPRFAIQVGAFLYGENSTRMVEELKGRGYEPYIVVKTSSADRTLETVRFGHYPSRQQATLAASEFMAREGYDTAIVREPGAL